MSSGRASAAAAGLVSIAFFVVSGLVFLVSAAYGVINPLFGGARGDLGALNYIGMFAVAPAIAAFGAALPAPAFLALAGHAHCWARELP